jgi:hypothetical protein
MSSALMKLLEEKGLTHLLGEILAAQLIDAIDHPTSTQELADFVQMHGKALRRKARKPPKKAMNV